MFNNENKENNETKIIKKKISKKKNPIIEFVLENNIVKETPEVNIKTNTIYNEECLSYLSKIQDKCIEFDFVVYLQWKTDRIK